MRAKNALIGLTILIALGVQTPALATNFLWDDWSTWPYGFSAAFSQQKTEVDVEEQASHFDLTRASLELVELNNTWLQAGMFAGKVWGDQTGFAPSNGVSLDGYFAGLSLRRMIFDGRWFKLGLEGRYTYNLINDNEVPKRIEVSLHQSDVALGAELSLGRYVALYGGATAMYLTGNERVTGSPSSDLGGDWSEVVFAGIDLTIETNGHIGVEAKKGAVDGFEVYFQHRY